MALFARVENEQVIERRELTSIPPHKAALWLPVVIEGSGSKEQMIVEADRVRIVRSVPPVTVEQVANERDRRLAFGFDYNFGGARGTHHIGTTKRDLEGWSEVSTYAGALIDSGDLATQIAIATDTGPCLVTAPEWRAVEIASASFRQPLWAKSFALMARSPIPADYTDDRHWT
jgi:hypothetical protein